MSANIRVCLDLLNIHELIIEVTTPHNICWQEKPVEDYNLFTDNKLQGLVELIAQGIAM